MRHVGQVKTLGNKMEGKVTERNFLWQGIAFRWGVLVNILLLATVLLLGANPGALGKALCPETSATDDMFDCFKSWYVWQGVGALVLYFFGFGYAIVSVILLKRGAKSPSDGREVKRWAIVLIGGYAALALAYLADVAFHV